MEGRIDCVGGGRIYSVYLDVYFLLNFWMNLWVLFLCRIFLHSKVKIKKVVLSAVMASIGECLVLLLPVGDSRFKAFFGFGAVTAGVLWFLFRPSGGEAFSRLLVTAYMTALVLGGSLELLETVFQWEQLSVLGLCTITVVFSMGMKYVYKRFKDKVQQDFVDVWLTFSSGECCRVVALVDSGNGLIEPISKKPVSLVEQRVISSFVSSLSPSDFRVVPFHSVGKSQGMLEAYFIDKLEMKKEGEGIVIERPVIGITKEVISANEKYQMILHPALWKNQEE